MMARIGVLAVQGAFREHVRALERCGADTLLIRKPLGDGPHGGLDCLDALVLPGGESTSMARLLVDWGLLEPIRRCGLDGMPLLGTCAGLILLCRSIVTHAPGAFSGQDSALSPRNVRPSDQARLGLLDATVLRNAFGRQTDSFECDLEVRGVTDVPCRALPPRPLRAVFIRAPLLLRCGPDVEVLARAPAREGESPLPVAVRQGRVLGASFHPELTDDPRLHACFLSLISRG